MMDKKLNKKGFTLVELLAVIVVLALILVLTVPMVLNTMNSAKKKSFQMYGERVLNSAMSLYESQKMLNEITTKKYDGEICYTLSDLGLTSTGSYVGMVVVTPTNNADLSTEYTVYLTDMTYNYEGAVSADVLNNTDVIINATDDGNALKALVEECK